jgi:hypothetical protein
MLIVAPNEGFILALIHAYSHFDLETVKALLPVVRRLRERFGIARMCVVADRGMISAETINELEALGLEYILGARERSNSEVRKVVLADEAPMVPLVVTRARGGETALEVKEVVVGDWGPGCKPRRNCAPKKPFVFSYLILVRNS